jgi:predicted nuclease of predicted toxin-antitoxin system
MHILIDECLPKKLKQELHRHTVFTVQEKGWSGLENGDLLRVAENEFDVWVTADKNVEYQQNLDRFDIAIVVLVAYRNRLDALLPLMPQLREVLQVIQSHQIVYIES